MKFLLLFLLAFAPLGAAESLFVTPAGGKAVPSLRVALSGTDTVTAVLVYGGLGDAPSATWAGKVVLLDRGIITYNAKLDAVQSVGGLAAIVANNVAGAANSTSLTAGTTSTLPGVSVSQADGVALKLLVGSAVRVGTVAPPYVPPVASALPDPKGHKGELLSSDGEKWVFIPQVITGPVISTGEVVALGGNVTFSVTADGEPAPTFQWMKDGIQVGVGNQYQIIGAQASHAGLYSATATNELGTAKSNEIGLSVR